jgi:choline kinase
MKMIILAAGQGTRLKPYTNNVPKCMVKFKQKPIIDYILETAKNCKIDKIAIIGGYKIEILKNYLKDKNISFFNNKNFETTNMVHSLFCSKKFMDDDLIISYSDIIYKKSVLKKLISSDYDFSVVIDKEWRKLWELRMENPLEDAETLKIFDNNIIEIGKKPKTYYDIQGQYIGLFKISKKIVNQIIKYYFSLDTNSYYDEKNFDNMYMTSFIQLVLDNLLKVKPIFIEGGWIEIDSINDLKILEGVDENFNI